LHEAADGQGGVEGAGAGAADGGEAKATDSDVLQQTVKNAPGEGAVGTAAL
jgi:hypothetical protein